ncbi:Glucoamylase (glucan-1,4-alpha-glucosidase), GH15 family [Haloechinothrix alba]|uniref:Trehalase n=1 Tax=Haloechinothrix alba TaxID=664784 RepID=A0A238W904_9PSEU|nr:glycoside hydrolase family 15 protein [Haloechinothrix alba]SNR42149.1 Glucoamylase (glucan-1,4-alpha-glucosidase), GH15 family [Haloechinothrix alba]
MSSSHPIEDYALIGDTETAALVCRSGSIDWLCLPQFDARACFAALLGDVTNGRWLLAPAGEVTAVRRRYRPGTLVLETEFDTAEGTVRVVDAMPPRPADGRARHDVVRLVEGVAGRVAMTMELVIRFDYGSLVPWVTRRDGRLRAVAGPDAITLASPVEVHGRDLRTVGDFTVDPGEQVPFELVWHPSHEPAPPQGDVPGAVDATTQWWQQWSGHSIYQGDYAEAVQRSLITLKALTYRPTGAIVAAPTTSLPEQLGGERNWDYRYAWLRDATFALQALMQGGYREESVAWRDWLLRAVAGDPKRLQIMYGIAGEHRLPELTLDWLAGYANSRPVRIGNAASTQRQHDVYGEVMDALHYAREVGIDPEPEAWSLQRALLSDLESRWNEPDEGIWEIRGTPQHFTHSKVMAWVAFDRAVTAVERHGLDGPVEHWRELRSAIHAEVCAKGYNAERNTFTQFFGGTDVDASLLLIPIVGFLPADDPRVAGTVDAVIADLSVDETCVLRYATHSGVDGLPDGEGAFLLCSFWLVDALVLLGRYEEARARFERLLAVRNDVGLLAEEYAPGSGQLGNFPQAFSHIGLIGSACNLAREWGPASERAGKHA